MVNLLLINIQPKHVAIISIKLQNTIKKLNNTASSMAFIKKALFVNVISVFAKVRGQFLNEENRTKSSQNILKSHLTKHIQDLYNFSVIYDDLRISLLSEIGHVFGKAIIFSITMSLAKHRYFSLKTKNKKLTNLIRSKKQVVIKHYSVLIINIFKFVLSHKEEQQLKLGLKHSFADKNKNIKKLLAANMERITERVENSSDHDQVENFHEFVGAYTDIFTTNIFATKDHTYHNLKDITRDKDLVLFNGDKDSSVVVINRIDYNNIMQKMIDDGIKNKIYEETTDNTLKYLKNCQ